MYWTIKQKGVLSKDRVGGFITSWYDAKTGYGPRAAIRPGNSTHTGGMIPHQAQADNLSGNVLDLQSLQAEAFEQPLKCSGTN